MSTVRTARPSWWEGVGSPGVGGYVLAYVASAVALIVVSVLGGILEGGANLSIDELASGVGVLVVGTIYALVFGAPAAVIGCFVVHLVCLRVVEQPVHVLVAGLAGAVAGVAYELILFSGSFSGGLWILLGLATAIGRAAVIPLARARMQRRAS